MKRLIKKITSAAKKPFEFRPKNPETFFVQITLLILIAGGILLIAHTLQSGGTGNQPPAGPPPAGMSPGARPSGPPTAMPGDSAPPSEKGNAIAVETYTVVPQTVQEYIKVNGDIAAERTISMYPNAAGEITARNISVGQYVQIGQQLAVVDPSQAGQRFSPSPIVSTIAGTVTAIHVEVGDTVSQQTAIASVGDLSRLEIISYIPERYAAAIHTGLVAEITLEAFPDEIFQARVVEVSPVVNTTSRTVEVSLAFVEQDERIKAGMFASLRLITREETNVIAVPPHVITQYYNEPVVFVVGQDNIVERRTVSRGLTSSDFVQITTGLEAGETVISAGITKVSEGTEVRIVSTDETGEDQ